VLFETIIVVPETAGEPAVWCDGPSPCHLRQRHQQRDSHDEQHCSDIRHRPHGAALELVNDYTRRRCCRRVQTVFELRRDIAKDAALRRLGSSLTNF
jgi:hypothetical protein